MELLEKAIKLATQAHVGQTYNSLTYVEGHLARVASCIKCKEPVEDEATLAMAYLHDTIEDTAITYESLKTYISQEVADGVQALTIPKTGGNRKERFELTLPLLLVNEKAIKVRLADRIINMLVSLEQEDLGKVCMYLKEYSHFKEKLYDAKYDRYWKTLDHLFFQSELFRENIGTDLHKKFEGVEL